MEKLAKFFEHDLKNGDFELFDKNNNVIYYENFDGYWSKRKYDQDGNKINFESSDGYRIKRDYDKNGNEIYYESSSGYWSKREYDKNNNQIYFENSDGEITNNRSITCIDKEIMIDGKKYQLVEREE